MHAIFKRPSLLSKGYHLEEIGNVSVGASFPGRYKGRWSCYALYIFLEYMTQKENQSQRHERKYHLDEIGKFGLFFPLAAKQDLNFPFVRLKRVSHPSGK